MMMMMRTYLFFLFLTMLARRDWSTTSWNPLTLFARFGFLENYWCGGIVAWWMSPRVGQQQIT